MANELLFIEKVPVNRTEFGNQVRDIAFRLGLNADWLMGVMNIETRGSFSPSVRNGSTGATGLIQFLPSTAAELGTSTTALANMSNLQQLDYVERYYANVIKRYGPLDSVTNTYLAVFYPAAILWPMDKHFPDNVHRVNPLFDPQKKGYFTKQDVENTILGTIPAQRQLGTVTEKKN